MDHIKAIEDALAAGPTPGVWEAGSAGVVESQHALMIARCMYIVPRPGWSGTDYASGAYAEANAAYIAACHPEAIRSLLDRLREAEAVVDRLKRASSALALLSKRLPENIDVSDAIRMAEVVVEVAAAMKETP